MRRDWYDTFDDDLIPYHDQSSFKEPKHDYMIGESSTFTIDYQDTAIFPFKIPCCYWQSTIKLTLIDFRGEIIYCDYFNVQNNGLIYFNLDYELSSKLDRGTYRCRLQAITYNLGGIDDVATILGYDQCSFYVR